MIAWICGALACDSIGRHPREILQIVTRLAADRARALRLRPHPRRRRLARDRRPRAPDDRLRPLRLLRRDADRMAAVPPLRARRRQLVGRRLHARLHLLLHRPLRPRRHPLGRATGSPSCASPSAWSRWRSPALATYIVFPAAPPWMAGEDGPARRRPPHHLGGLGGARGGHRRALLQGPDERQPGRRRALAALRLHGPGGDVPLEPGAPAACGRCWRSTRWRWASP